MSDLSPRTGPDTAVTPRRKRKWLPIVVLGIVLVSGGVIVTQFLRSAVDYYCNVDEIDVRSGCDGDRRLRLQGVVERGSIVEAGGDTEFLMGFNGVTIPVHYDGEPGGIFKECIAVVVHGRFDGATRVFEGDRVEVKHSDEYVAVNDERLAESDELSDECETGAVA
jgi:cytochrome c-type biogenesis protein CcmE